MTASAANTELETQVKLLEGHERCEYLMVWGVWSDTFFRRNAELEELMSEMRDQKDELSTRLSAVEAEREELDQAMQVLVVLKV